jgi:CubicO group peptidase (beta-lactamase class C family)
MEPFFPDKNCTAYNVHRKRNNIKEKTMIRRIHSLKVIFLLVIMGAAPKAGAQELSQRIEMYLADQVRTHCIPGLTAAVVRNGEVAYIGAFGVRQIGGNEKLTPEHIFHFASVSKPFVATAIMQLVEQEKLDLDDPVTKYLPYFRLDDDRYRAITIRQMLNHTSGMPDVHDYQWENPQTDEGAAERYVRQIASKRLLWAPGEGWRYSNMAFDVLGDLIAKVSGVSFEEFIRANIFVPVGMDRSSFIYSDIQESLRTTGHVGEPAQISDIYPYNRRHAPSSTLNTSVNQMTRWMLVNLNKGEINGRRILRAESYDLLWTARIENATNESQVGLSWFLGEHAGHRTVGHGGGDTGFRSYILLLPEKNIGIVLASNWSRTNTEDIVLGILDLVLASNDL